MKRLCIVAFVALVSACGVDGEPVQPTATTSVGVGSDGVSASTGVKVKKGSFTVGWGIGL